MKILFIGATPKPDSMESHVLDGLAALQHQVQFVDIRTLLPLHQKLDRYAQKIAQILCREPERLHEAKVLAAVEAFQPELILVLLGNGLSPKTVSAMRRLSRAPVVCWSQDQLSTIGRQYIIGSEYDWVFFKDPYIVDLFTRMLPKSRFGLLHEACNPAIHRAVPLSADDLDRYGCDVTTAATLYYYRQQILQSLGDCRLRVWGARPDWLDYRLGDAHQGRGVYLDEKCKAFRAAKIVLNTLHYAEVAGLNCRAFEIAGIGGFQMINSVEAIEGVFEADKEVVVFRDIDELQKKIRHFLADDAHRQAIASAGQRRAYAEHTYAHRLQQLIATVSKG